MEPAAIDLDQPYPYPMRARGQTKDTLEIRYAITGKSVTWYRWTYVSGTERSGFESGVVKGKSAAEARKMLDEMVAGTRKMGWIDLPSWPKASGKSSKKSALISVDLAAIRAQPAAKHKATRPKKITPLPLAKVRVAGKLKPRPASETAFVRAFGGVELPPSFVAWLGKLGFGTFTGRLSFREGPAMLKITKTWRKGWTDDAARLVWSNWDTMLAGRIAELVIFASSIDGDQVAFVAGVPGRIYILPRHRELVVRCKDLSEVLGFFYEISKNADGDLARPTFVPARP